MLPGGKRRRTRGDPDAAYGRQSLTRSCAFWTRRMCSRIDAIRRLLHGLRGPTEIEENMRKSLPEQMFADPEKSRLTMLRSWVLDQQVTEIDMNERQFWNFAALQPVAE